MTTINHTEYPASLVNKTEAELRYAMADAYRAIQAFPDGKKVGYYADEINYVCNELHRRDKMFRDLQNLQMPVMAKDSLIDRETFFSRPEDERQEYLAWLRKQQ